MDENNRPLAGKRVVITRAREQSAEFARLLEEAGAEVFFLPSVAFEPPLDTEPLDAAIHALADFDWIFFTSQNAVRFFTERCHALGFSPGQVPLPKVAAVGPATAAEAERCGFPVHYVAHVFRGEAMAAELGKELTGKKVLLPRSDRAGTSLPVALKALGATVTDVVAYRTVAASSDADLVREKLLRGEMDVLAFASPSAFHNLVAEVGLSNLANISTRVALAAIGPVTASAIRAAGLPVAIEARESTVKGLVHATIRYFKIHSNTGVQPS